MRWTYSVKSKLTAAGLLFVVIALVFINNLHERKNSAAIDDALSTLYADRLVVEGYIFEFSCLFNDLSFLTEKEHLKTDKAGPRINDIFTELSVLSKKYKDTFLTPEEEGIFGDLSLLCQRMKREADMGEYSAVHAQTQEAVAALHSLSNIQMKEGKTQLTNAKRLYHSGLMSSRFEMAMLVVIALMLQGLVFASKSLQDVPQQSGHHLN